MGGKFVAGFAWLGQGDMGISSGRSFLFRSLMGAQWIGPLLFRGMRSKYLIVLIT
jgi:hypothetical protein